MSLFPPPLPVSVAVVCSSAPALWPACEPTAFAMHCEIIMAIWQRCPVEYRGGWVGGACRVHRMGKQAGEDLPWSPCKRRRYHASNGH